MRRKLTPSLLYRTTIVFMALVMTIFPNTAALAFDEQFYSSNNILYYEPGSGTCVEPGASYTTRMDLPSLVGDSNAEKIWNFFIDKGLTPEQTAGIMGNIRKESNFEPDITEGDPSWAGAGFGIMQWTGLDLDGDGENDLDPRGPIRRTQLENAAKEAGVQPSDLSFQLAYAYQEIQGMQVGSFGVNNGRVVPGTTPEDNLWEAIKNQTDYTQVAILFHDGYLRSADSDEEIKSKRGGEYAQQAFESFKDLVGGGGGSTSVPRPSGGGAGCAPFSGGDIQSLVVEYAWPEHNEAPYFDMKPAYKAAVEDGIKKGYNVGGGEHPGIDCAGFVNLLVVNSGFDPSYNFNGKGNDSAGNTGEAQHRTWMHENWEYLGEGGTGGSSLNVADLLPGDVAVSKEDVSFRLQHIFIYVGQIDGFSSQFASASYLSWRTPMAAASGQIGADGNPVGNYENVTSADYIWFRKR